MTLGQNQTNSTQEKPDPELVSTLSRNDWYWERDNRKPRVIIVRAASDPDVKIVVKGHYVADAEIAEIICNALNG